MALTTLSFVFVFLPLSTAAYYLSPAKAKNAVLLAVSLIYYWLMAPSFLWLIVLSVLCDYLLAYFMHKNEEREGKRRLFLSLCVLKNLGMFILSAVLYEIWGTQQPFGLYIYTITAMGYVIDLYKRHARFEPSFIDFSLFCVMYPKLFIGPLTRYNEMRFQLKSSRISLSAISGSIILFTQGLAKQVFFADNLMEIYRVLVKMPLDRISLIGVWVMVISLALGFYFTLLGFSDMARGLAGIYGYELSQNFRYPFQATTVNEFFARFNISVTRFIRHYVYFELGGDRGNTLSTALNIFLTTLLMGLWYGINLNYLVWGAYFAVIILLERFIFKRLLVKIPPFFTRIYSFCVTLISFAIFAGPTLSISMQYIQKMFTYTADPVDASTLYLLSSNWAVLILAVLFCTNVTSIVADFFKKRYPLITDILSVAINTGLLVITTAFLL